ncbi:MAG TPA: phenylalanine--tRNA ligase subunit beta [Burkholderiaceae bacterium]|nr:phenylalanine--tRNA ligase subunit beta [Burkholderiaceae bacterium]
MQFSERWLRHYANPAIGSEELAHRLTMSGLEVEESVPVAPPFNGVVVAHVVSVARHPNADKLTVCEVDAGTGAKLSIVCGAPNVAAGVRVPCALEGAVLPGDFRIERTTMRGVESQGMLCSARELGLSEDQSGLMILDADAPIGQDIRAALDLDDRKLTIKLTPNRADCLSVTGVAREVAAITGAALKLPSFDPIAPLIDDHLPVRVDAPDLCGRFSGRVIRGVDAHAPTPDWMKQRLERSGQRPISALVDISNYVMLELGRPSHVFDLDKVRGGLTVRWGRPGEQVHLLNGQTVAVDAGVGVICDDAGVEAMAGIMGGEATAVSLDTRNVYVEAAFWWPDSIRGRSRRYNFSTDAAHRFERGVDFATTVDHIEYITRLILTVCGGKPGPVDDTVLALPERKPVTMRIERCRRVLGIPIEAKDMADAFRRLGLAFEEHADRFVVTPPTHRFDLEIEEDLIEEVARLFGFERIPAEPPRAAARMRTRREEQRSMHDVRRALARDGYQELVNYSFVDTAWEQDFAGNPDPIRVLNPIASQMSVMRSTLLGGLVGALVHNLNRKQNRARLFEVGRVFLRDPEVRDGPLAVQGIAQPTVVAGLAYGPAEDEQWGVAARDVDFFDVKGDIERWFAPVAVRFVRAEHPALHPGRSAFVEANGTTAGFVGEVHPKLQQKYELPKAAIVFEVDLAPLLARPLPRFSPVSKFQPVTRDISITVDDEVPVGAIEAAVLALSRADSRLSALREFRLFDVYRPRNDSSKVAEASANALLNKEKSLAFRVVLQDTERALNDDDADAAVGAIVEGLEKQCGARLRR